ncbi:hypothetical protein GCM10010166_49880 [Couchioplanes caeruleus subsp. azureus]|nr:hypothetical protein GCM10010166_49880 [Couchioplanes caeruleus subsp. azureus]
MTSQLVAPGPMTERTESVSSRYGSASRAAGSRPYSPGVMAWCGPDTQSSSSR